MSENKLSPIEEARAKRAAAEEAKQPEIIKSVYDEIRDEVYSRGFAVRIPAVFGVDVDVENISVAAHEPTKSVIIIAPGHIIALHPQCAQQVGPAIDHSANAILADMGVPQPVGIAHRLKGKLIAGTDMANTLGIPKDREDQIIQAVSIAMSGSRDFADTLNKLDRSGKYTEFEWALALYAYGVLQRMHDMQTMYEAQQKAAASGPKN